MEKSCRKAFQAKAIVTGLILLGLSLLTFGVQPAHAVQDDLGGEDMCGFEPADIFIMMDRTGSVSSSQRQEEEDAAKALIQFIGDNDNGHTIGIGRFAQADCGDAGNFPDDQDDEAEVFSNPDLKPVSSQLEIDSVKQDAEDAMDDDSCSGTNLKSAIEVAELALSGGSNTKKVIILISDGDPWKPCNDSGDDDLCTDGNSTDEADADTRALAAADAFKLDGGTIFTIGFDVNGSGNDDANNNRPLLAAMASQPSAAETCVDPGPDNDTCQQDDWDAENTDGDFFFLAPDFDAQNPGVALTAILNKIGSEILCDDNFSCTEDACNENTDMCEQTPDDSVCDDQNPCTDEQCEADPEAVGDIVDPETGCVYNFNNNDLQESCYTGPDGTEGVGICTPGSSVCSEGEPECQGDVTPEVGDATCNSTDEDCDGEEDEDFPETPTECGVGACASNGVESCENGQVVNSCTPGNPAPNDATCDNTDDDCDGEEDEDFPETPTECGVGACASNGVESCENGQVLNSCTPGEPGVGDPCDGIDNDCDGQIDEDFVSVPTNCGMGECARVGATQCVNGEITNTCTPGDPTGDDSDCDNLDNNCNGQIDENFVPEPTECGDGVCANTGETSCVEGDVQNSCEPLDPTNEDDSTCDGLDDNCNGQTDEDFVPEEITCGVGACENTILTACVEGEVDNFCDPGESTDELCDGIDNDCDEEVDEGGVCDEPPPTPEAEDAGGGQEGTDVLDVRCLTGSGEAGNGFDNGTCAGCSLGATGTTPLQATAGMAALVLLPWIFRRSWARVRFYKQSSEIKT